MILTFIKLKILDLIGKFQNKNHIKNIYLIDTTKQLHEQNFMLVHPHPQNSEYCLIEIEIQNVIQPEFLLIDYMFNGISYSIMYNINNFQNNSHNIIRFYNLDLKKKRNFEYKTDYLYKIKVNNSENLISQHSKLYHKLKKISGKEGDFHLNTLLENENNDFTYLLEKEDICLNYLKNTGEQLFKIMCESEIGEKIVIQLEDNNKYICHFELTTEQRLEDSDDELLNDL
jgi:hypothetical protein